MSTFFRGGLRYRFGSREKCRLVKGIGALGLRALLSIPLPSGRKPTLLPPVSRHNRCFVLKNLRFRLGFMDRNGRNLLSFLKVAIGGDGDSRRICGNG